MKEFVCSVCSYTYDESKGIPEAGIAPGTPWEELPGDWKCPWCGAGKEAFNEKGGVPAEPVITSAPHAEKELSPMEMSIICSNLAKGCEKQYLAEQAENFTKLAQFFRRKAEPVSQPGIEKLLELLEKDLQVGFPYGGQVAKEYSDRGAQRCQVWSEKVTRMLQSLLNRYAQEGEKMLENTGVYVCTVCGFVYVGDKAPDLCPVCKVPAWKFEKVERSAM